MDIVALINEYLRNSENYSTKYIDTENALKVLLSPRQWERLVRLKADRTEQIKKSLFPFGSGFGSIATEHQRRIREDIGLDVPTIGNTDDE